MKFRIILTLTNSLSITLFAIVYTIVNLSYISVMDFVPHGLIFLIIAIVSFICINLVDALLFLCGKIIKKNCMALWIFRLLGFAVLFNVPVIYIGFIEKYFNIITNSIAIASIFACVILDIFYYFNNPGTEYKKNNFFENNFLKGIIYGLVVFFILNICLIFKFSMSGAVKYFAYEFFILLFLFVAAAVLKIIAEIIIKIKKTETNKKIRFSNFLLGFSMCGIVITPIIYSFSKVFIAMSMFTFMALISLPFKIIDDINCRIVIPTKIDLQYSSLIAKLPPNPGRAGKKTLLGIDSDNDGVRDDIQIAVTKLIPDDPYKRASLMFRFATIQMLWKAIIENPKESWDFYYPYYMWESAGMDYIWKTGARDIISVEQREKLFCNTPDRRRMSRYTDHLASGKAFPSISNFDYPDSLRKEYEKKFQEFYEREQERQTGPIAKLPPNPGTAGKKTVLGIDSDGDGVRDDIQIAVTKLIPDDPYARAGAMFTFKMHNELFRAYLDGKQSFEELYPYFLGINAGNKYWIASGTQDIISDAKYSTLQYNTRERFLLSEKIDSLANGKAFSAYEYYPEFKEKYDAEFQKVYELEKERQKSFF